MIKNIFLKRKFSYCHYASCSSLIIFSIIDIDGYRTQLKGCNWLPQFMFTLAVCTTFYSLKSNILIVSFLGPLSHLLCCIFSHTQGWATYCHVSPVDSYSFIDNNWNLVEDLVFFLSILAVVWTFHYPYTYFSLQLLEGQRIRVNKA